MPARNPSSASRSTTVSGRDRQAHGELAQHRSAAASGSTPATASERVAAVARAPRAAQGHLGHPRRPEPAQLDGRGHRHQGLVGADVGGRLLAPDVLLAGAQRGDVGAPALDVDGLAHQAAGQASHVRQRRRRTGRGRARRSRAACRGPGPPPPPRRPPSRRASAGSRRRPGRTPRRAGRRCGRTTAAGLARSSRHPGSWGRRPPRRPAGRPPSAGRVRPVGHAVDQRHVSTRWPVPAAKVASTSRQWGGPRPRPTPPGAPWPRRPG